MRRLNYLVLLLCTACFLNAQDYSIAFEKFSTEDGLPSNTILDIVQDHEGYLWLATEDGLVRYDGYSFLTYTNIPEDSTSLSQNRVEKLFVDFKGDVWIGSKSGLDRYNSACDCFFRFTSPAPAASDQQAGQINAFVEDRDKNLWIGTQNGGLFRYDREGDHFIRVLDDPSNPDNLLNDQVRVLMVDRHNQLWIGTGETFDVNSTGGGLVRLDIKTGKTTRWVHDSSDSNSLIDNRVSALLEDREGIVWVGTCRSGLQYYDHQKNEFVRMMPDPGQPNRLSAPQGNMGLWSSCAHVRFIHQSPNGEFWVGTYNGGINRYDPATQTIYTYRNDPDDNESLGSNQVWSFLQDRQGRIWVGNLPGGLHKVDPSLHKFKVYTHNPEDTTSLSLDYVMGVYEAPDMPGRIWLGTRGGGLNSLNSTTGRFQVMRHHPKNKQSISSDIVWTTYLDRSGTFWVGTEAGLDTLNRQTGQFNAYKILENNTYHTIPHPIIRIHEDREGRLWLGTWSKGIIRLSKNKKSIERYPFSYSSQQSFYNSVYDIHEDSNGTIWVGVFQGGLFQYEARNDRFIPHLEAYGATSIVEESSGVFWIGTTSSGLLRYNSMTGFLEQFTTKDGLSTNSIYGILADENNMYWLSTGNGIVRFDPVSKRFTSYDESDGLSFTGFNHTSAFMTLDGELFFGGEGGLVSFYPDQINGNPYPPDVIISGLQVAGKTVDLEAYKMDTSTPKTFTHQQNDLTFEYVGLHFTNPAKNAYKYRLHPYDAEWIEASHQRTARYTNLDPGEYTFQVIACNSDGIWNEKGAALLFNITPPWWNRWWAYALFSVTLLGIGNWFYRFQLSRKLAVAEYKRLSEIDQLKNSLYTNITHEFRTPLTVILGMSDVLRSRSIDQQWKDAEQPLEMIQRNSNGLLLLVNEMLDLSKLESGHMDLELLQGDVVPLIKYLCEGFQSLAQEKMIDLAVSTQTEPLIMDFDAAKLSVIVSNLLSNAVKFTPEKGRIWVHLDQFLLDGHHYFSFNIKDNGIGMHQDEIPYVFDRFYQVDHTSTRRTEGTGIGLALTKELVELMHGTISIKSKPGTGSEFTVRIPITTQAPKASDAQEMMETALTGMPGTSLVEIEHHQKGNRPMVLIIEDNVDVAHYLKITLVDKYECLHAQTGESGLELAYKNIPDIIICDVMMPGMDGFEVCAQLKGDERTDHIPIIMLTAKVSIEHRLAGLSMGADAYLAKPFEKAELMIRLEKLLELRRKLQQKYDHPLLGSKHRDVPKHGPVESFLQKVEDIILDHLEEEDFSVDQLAGKLCLSRSQVHRKIKALTGHSTSIYIRLIRLHMAKKLLATGDLNVSEVAYRVGFKSPVYFSQIFKKTFGETPSENRK